MCSVLAFMTSFLSDKRGIFRAYDIRGVYPKEINEGALERIVQALGKRFTRGSLVVGHDARLSSPTLYKTTLRTLHHTNKLKNVRMKIIDGGLMTTPMFYFLVNKFNAAGGIMITASHNPKNWNGLKVVGKKAVMISGKDILKIL